MLRIVGVVVAGGGPLRLAFVVEGPVRGRQREQADGERDEHERGLLEHDVPAALREALDGPVDEPRHEPGEGQRARDEGAAAARVELRALGLGQEEHEDV